MAQDTAPAYRLSEDNVPGAGLRDPDNGANIDRKLESLRSSGLDLALHPNLAPSPEVPEQGWTSGPNWLRLAPVTFRSVYRNFAERPEGPSVEDVDEGDVDPEDNSLLAHSIASQHSASSRESHADSSLQAFRGLSKGFRIRFFFKDVDIF